MKGYGTDMEKKTANHVTRFVNGSEESYDEYKGNYVWKELAGSLEIKFTSADGKVVKLLSLDENIYKLSVGVVSNDEIVENSVQKQLEITKK